MVSKKSWAEWAVHDPNYTASSRNDNKYPGCCCDIWGSLYSFSFAQKSDWTREYPSQEEILAYLTETAQEYNLYQHIRFNSTVEAAKWDDKTSQWRTTVTVAKGSKDAEFIPQYEITSDFLVSAVGQLNQPRWPEEIEGINEFSGKKMHSARWDWSYNLEGKNIALLGNGKSLYILTTRFDSTLNNSFS